MFLVEFRIYMAMFMIIPWNQSLFLFDIQEQIEGEEALGISKRRLERERARHDATADMSEDLSEGEKGDVSNDLSAHGDSNKSRMPRISSAEAIEAWASQYKDRKLYIVLIRYGPSCQLHRRKYWYAPPRCHSCLLICNLYILVNVEE